MMRWNSSLIFLAALASVGACTGANAATVNSVTVVVPRVDIAAPGQTVTDPGLIVWQTYDNFSGPNINLSLWGTGGADTLTAGAQGLTLTPTPLPGLGQSRTGLTATFPVELGSYFAVRVPFEITAAVADLPGWVGLDIDLCGDDTPTDTPCDSTAWGLLNNFIPPGGTVPLAGTYFGAGDSNSPSGLAFEATTITQGELALIYSGGFFTNFINDGVGWRQIGGAFSPPPSWTAASGPLQFEFGAEVRVLEASAVPLPAAFALFGLGLAGFGLIRRATAPSANSAM